MAKTINIIGIDRDFIPDILVGLVVGVAYVLLSQVTLASLPLGNPGPLVPWRAIGISNLFLVVGILLPIAEESFVRGVMVGFFNRTLGFSISVTAVITGLIFAFWHFTAYGADFTTAGIGAFSFGIISVLLMINRNSIIAPITAHIVINLAIIAPAFLV